jgi:hypothetical protein
MVGEVDRRETVDRHETADAVKRFCLELIGCCGESSSTERGRTRPLNRILEAVKIRREPKRALSEQNERGLPTAHTSASRSRKALTLCSQGTINRESCQKYGIERNDGA